MYAIRTRYLGPTNNRGSRIKASTHPTGQVSVTIPYPYEMSGRACHFEAVKALLAKAPEWLPVDGWSEDNAIESQDGRGHIFVRC